MTLIAGGEIRIERCNYLCNAARCISDRNAAIDLSELASTSSVLQPMTQSHVSRDDFVHSIKINNFFFWYFYFYKLIMYKIQIRDCYG